MAFPGQMASWPADQLCWSTLRCTFSPRSSHHPFLVSWHSQLFAGAAPGAVALGNVSVVAAHTLAAANVTGLSSEEHYRICAAAEDTTRLRNRQSTPSHVDFATLDVTAPRLDVAVLSGHDGNFTCERCGCSTALQGWLGIRPRGRGGAKASLQASLPWQVSNDARFYLQIGQLQLQHDV